MMSSDSVTHQTLASAFAHGCGHRCRHGNSDQAITDDMQTTAACVSHYGACLCLSGFICISIHQCVCFCVEQFLVRCNPCKTALSAARPKANSRLPAASSGRATMAKAITSIAFLMRMVSDVAGPTAAVLPKRQRESVGKKISWAMSCVCQAAREGWNGVVLIESRSSRWQYGCGRGS